MRKTRKPDVEAQGALIRWWVNVVAGTPPPARDPSQARPGYNVRGERNGAARLTRQDVLIMRKLARHGAPFDLLARAWGVEETTTAQAVRRQSWAWLQDEDAEDSDLGPPPDSFDDLSDVNTRVVDADPPTATQSKEV